MLSGNQLETVGSDWLIEQVLDMADEVERVTPVKFNEQNRYLPPGVSPRPGYIRYDLFPFLREIIECFDVNSPVREVNLMKGVQVGYTTLLESVLLYYIVHVKTHSAMFLTADRELAGGRVENYILPMINESGFGDLIRSSDHGNARKTGKTKTHLQWDGGGFLIYNGAMNAAKMRQYSVPLMLKDELDGWKANIGKDGNSDALTDARCSAFWSNRKILRGSTPLVTPSMIEDAYKKGDQRKYVVCCKSCGHPQELRRENINQETGIVGGFRWDLEAGGTLNLESVRYCCVNCGHAHYEHDKDRLFSAEHGAHWEPTAKPVEPNIRSYHLPSFYSPFGFRPWYKCVSDYLESYNDEAKQVRSIPKFQEYYNNTLGKPFTEMGFGIRFTAVSGHRRHSYRCGEIPNDYAEEHSGTKILFLTCTVDVHKQNLAVAVMGWTRNACCYVIDYWRFEVEDTHRGDADDVSSPVWQRLRDLIESKRYHTDDGFSYRIMLTLVDAGYANDVVCTFCSEYDSGVYPIIGRDRSAKSQKIAEFVEFKTQLGTTGYKILVDHYKDRLSPVLRRQWSEELGPQDPYHFNAPLDLHDKQLKELTVEIRKTKIDERGSEASFWYRRGNARNELWDLLVYAHAAVEIKAWSICLGHFQTETVDWAAFWEFAESPDNDELFGRLENVGSGVA